MRGWREAFATAEEADKALPWLETAGGADTGAEATGGAHSAA
jgi:hypothetical protein